MPGWRAEAPTSSDVLIVTEPHTCLLERDLGEVHDGCEPTADAVAYRPTEPGGDDLLAGLKSAQQADLDGGPL